jgi:hypothetical protein
MPRIAKAMSGEMLKGHFDLPEGTIYPALGDRSQKWHRFAHAVDHVLAGTSAKQPMAPASR